jgi:hypothetical protein
MAQSIIKLLGFNVDLNEFKLLNIKTLNEFDHLPVASGMPAIL